MRYLAFAAISLMVVLACSSPTPSEKDLFTRAQGFEASQDYIRALETYDTIIAKYPDSPNRYKAIFMKGYIYTDILKDKNRAIENFDILLTEYPDCDLADDAKIMRQIAESGGDLMSVFKDSLKTK